MTNIETTMYTLGQLARAIWPDGDAPKKLIDTALTRPASGLALITQHKAAARADQEAIAAILDRMPADIKDPAGGVKIADQGPFWMGWYHYMMAITHARKLGPEHLERAGRLLYGDRWQTDLSRDIGVADRTVRSWIARERGIPAGVWADIAALLRQRSNEGLALLAELDHQ